MTRNVPTVLINERTGLVVYLLDDEELENISQEKQTTIKKQEERK